MTCGIDLRDLRDLDLRWRRDVAAGFAARLELARYVTDAELDLASTEISEPWLVLRQRVDEVHEHRANLARALFEWLVEPTS